MEKPFNGQGCNPRIENVLNNLSRLSLPTRRHSVRVAEISVFLGQRMGLGPKELDSIYQGGLLHDIGKLGFPAIVNSSRPLSDNERRQMRIHPFLGYLLGELDLPPDSIEQAIILNHHTFFNGDKNGYPNNISKESIPLPARIVSVADAFEAMTATVGRDYREIKSPDEALLELKRAAGVQFDPSVIDILETHFEEIINPMFTYQERERNWQKIVAKLITTFPKGAIDRVILYSTAITGPSPDDLDLVFISPVLPHPPDNGLPVGWEINHDIEPAVAGSFRIIYKRGKKIVIDTWVWPQSEFNQALAGNNKQILLGNRLVTAGQIASLIANTGQIIFLSDEASRQSPNQQLLTNMTIDEQANDAIDELLNNHS